MSSSTVVPNRVLIVDKRLVPVNCEQLHFVQHSHPRTKQPQSYAIDQQSKTIFEVIQCTRSHSSWFINDQHVLPDGSLYIVTPINVIFLLLPSIWSDAREQFLSTTTLNSSLKNLQLDEDFVLEKLTSICDIDSEKHSVKLNEEKLIKWFRDRVDRLKKHVEDEEHAFDLICEYVPDDIIEYCQQKLELHGNVRYELPTGQKSATVIKKTVESSLDIFYNDTFILGTLYLLEKRHSKSRSSNEKTTLTTNDTEVSKTVVDHAKQVLFEHHLNASQSSLFHEFHRIQNKSDCIFAKRARCWNAPHWLDTISVEDNCERLLPNFILFCAFVQEVSIDGYVIEIPHNDLTATLEDFGQILKKVLRYLSDHDPAKRHCMSVAPERIGQKGWVFQFDRVTFFITTFAPHYPENHPRYAHGSKKYCHILFQPEISFLRHNLPDDTPETNWSQPITTRDKTRVAFREHGREYPIRPTIYYPPAHDIIRPLSNDLDDIIEWWL
ncbi:unnamed protein product [Adineta ricciae]|uniref:Rnh202 triple barrel domain-containing protein n=1 Tax=Adineta ricciae TaxID=249248 RepID=A0A815Q5I9_ADIRI|nr:unnamed protein product [Adineta ricciae]CAF1458366.1 unnamed protein product [Adineta ricciae]